MLMTDQQLMGTDHIAITDLNQGTSWDAECGMLAEHKP